MLLAAIGFLVPSDQWGLSPWRWIILALVCAALAGATMTLLMQSREDTERDKKDEQRDTAQDLLMTQVMQLAAKGEEKSITAQAQTTTSPVPPGASFSFDNYFRLAHASQLTEGTAKEIGILADQQHPNDKEATLLKFIGIGFWGYMHEITWAYIFRSQILALTELNANGGRLPLGAIRAHFDKAAVDFPSTYKTYAFDQWMSYMTSHALFIHHSDNIVEITPRGRDFLKFMTHWGWSSDMRVN